MFHVLFEAFADSLDIFESLMNDAGEIRAPDDPTLRGLEGRLGLERKLFNMLLTCVAPRQAQGGSPADDGCPDAVSIVLRHQRDDNKGTEAWKALKDRFAPCNSTRSLSIYQHILSIKMDSGEAAPSFIARMERKYAELLAIKPEYTIPSPLRTALLLNALPSEYETFRTLITMTDEEELPSFTDICDKLASFSMQLEHRVKEETSQSALVFKAGAKSFVCFNCSMAGHAASKCRAPKSRCTTCGAHGHMSKYCEDVQRIKARFQRPIETPTAGKPVAFMCRGAESQTTDDNVENENETYPTATNNVITSQMVATAKKASPISSITSSNRQDIVCDTGASVRHMLNDSSYFVELHNTTMAIAPAVGSCMQASGEGTAEIPLRTMDGKVIVVTVKDALYVPELESSLISESKLAEQGWMIMAGCVGVIDTKHRHVSLMLQRNAQGLPCFVHCFSTLASTMTQHKDASNFSGSPSHLTASACVCPTAKSITISSHAETPALKSTHSPAQSLKMLQHKRLGHPNESRMNLIASKGLGTGMHISTSTKLPPCEPCMVAKSCKVPLSKGIIQASNHTSRLPKTSYQAARAPRKQPSGMHFTDLMGPVTPKAIGGISIVSGVVAADTGVIKVYPLKDKKRVLETIQHYNANVMTISSLRTDNDSVYKSTAFGDWCASNNISLSHSATYTHEQVGTVERAWRTLTVCALVLLHDACLPYEFWFFALEASAYLNNRVPKQSNPNSASPLEAHLGCIPNLSYLKKWGCRAYVHVSKERRISKLQPRARVGIFVGYQPNSNSYKVWVPDSWGNILVGKLYESRDVTFDETWCYDGSNGTVLPPLSAGMIEEELLVENAASQGSPSQPPVDTGDVGMHGPEEDDSDDDLPDLIEDSDSDDDDGGNLDYTGGDGDTHVSSPPPPRYPSRSRTAPGQWWVVQAPEETASPFTAHLPTAGGDSDGSVYSTEKESAVFPFPSSAPVQEELPNTAFMTSPCGDPVSVEDAMSRPDAARWQAALDKEVQSMVDRGVYEFVPVSSLPRGAKLIPNKVVFKRKYRADGTLDKYKARIVAKGCAQKAGKDYSETFAPTAKFCSLRSLISLGLLRAWELRQLDVETAFLYAPLEEEIWMKQPAGFEKMDEHGEPLIIRLRRSIYGLKQAPRNWFDTLSAFLISQGWQSSPHDPTAFTLRSVSGGLLGILVSYVDDIPYAIAPEAHASFVAAFENKFNITESALEWCLGVEVVQTSTTVELRQTKYINDLLHRFQMTDCKPASVPLAPGMVFSLKDSPKSEEEKQLALSQPHGQFRSLIGGLLYASVATRPDISNAVSKAGHVMSNPSPSHYKQALHVLRYLKGTKEKGIIFTKGDGANINILEGWCDADYGGCPDSRRSTTGYVFHLNGGPVAWKSKLQGAVAMSTTEAEYIALSEASLECVFLRGLLNDFGDEQTEPTVIQEDNFGCVQLTKNAVLHSRSKHIDIRHHKLRELVADKTISVQQCPTSLMVADVLTKTLPKQQFQHLRNKMMGYVTSLEALQ